MTLGIRSDASGTFGALTFGGDDAVTFDATGIQAGSYKAGSIVAADFADGALIENAPVGLGYGTGAGGTVTQATSKNTAVTLNKPCGLVTMNKAALAAGASVTFLISNTLFNIGSDLVYAQASAWAGSYRVECFGYSHNNIGIRVTNITAVSLSEAISLNFAIIKGATS